MHTLQQSSEVVSAAAFVDWHMRLPVLVLVFVLAAVAAAVVDPRL